MDASRRAVLAAGLSLASASAAIAQAPQSPDSLGGPWTSRGFVPRAGGRIHYVEMGEGEPLILLPKLGGWVADWRKIAPHLAQHRRVIAIDPPGLGDSTMLGDPPYVQSVAESAAMIRAALDEMRIDRFSLVGNSLGGCIGVITACDWPQSLNKLVLLSVSLAETYSWDRITQQDQQMLGVSYDAAGYPITRTSDDVKKFGTMDPSVIAENNLSRAKGGRWVRPSERGVARAGIADYLGRIQAPTLMIYGAQGYYRQYEPVALKGIHTVNSVTIPDCGSFTHQEKPEETARAINGFLDA